MKRLFLIDLCNTLFNINRHLIKSGFKITTFPEPTIPSSFWDTGDIYREAEVIDSIRNHLFKHIKNGDEIIYYTARPEHTGAISSDALKRNGFPEAPLLHTKGELKALHFRYITTPVIIYEDSPRELLGYRKYIPHAELYVPQWFYNVEVTKTVQGIALDTQTTEAFLKIPVQKGEINNVK